MSEGASRVALSAAPDDVSPPVAAVGSVVTPLGVQSRLRLLWLTIFRTVVGAMLLGVLAVQLRGRAEALGPSEVLSFGLAGLVFTVTLVTGLLLRSGWVPQAALWVHVVFDVALSSAVVLMTGRGESPFVFLFLVAVIGAAILLGRRGSLVAVPLSFAALVAISVSGGHWRAFDLAVAFLSQVLVGVLSAYVSEQLTRSDVRLTESRQDLERLSALQREIVTVMPSGLLTCDASGRATYANPAAQAMLGGEPPVELVRGLLAGLPPGTQRRVERVVTTHRGERTLGLSRAQLTGEPGASLLVFQDLTELRRLEGELRRIDHLAELGRVSAQLAHEVRNPLAAMRGAAQMLESTDDTHQATLSRLIVREADRLAALVEGYLQLARPPPPVKVAVRVAPLVQETLEMLKADPSFPPVEVALADGEVWADPAQVKQVLINLLRNAAAATGRKGRIRVSSARDASSGAFELAVWDSAGAVPQEDLERIFEPFFSKSVGGTGLGLSTVRTIMHAHGGEIRLTSSPEAGTTFTLIFPHQR